MILPSNDELYGLHDKRKRSVYFPIDMLREIKLEADRQDRSMSWIVQQAWSVARKEVMRFPSHKSRAV